MLFTHKPNPLREALDALELADRAQSPASRAKARTAVRKARASLAAVKVPAMIAAVDHRENRSLARIDILNDRLAAAAASLEEVAP
jgi:hypothetical protein